MEPTLHCAQARRRLRGALLRPRAREPLHLPLPRPEARRDHRLQHAPARAHALRRRRRLRQAADRPARRDELARREDGYVYINGKKLDEPYIRQEPARLPRGPEPIKIPQGHYFMMGDNRQPVLRLARVGDRAAREPDRQGLRHLLAAAANHVDHRASSATIPRRPSRPPFAMSKIIESIERASCARTFRASRRETPSACTFR